MELNISEFFKFSGTSPFMIFSSWPSLATLSAWVTFCVFHPFCRLYYTSRGNGNVILWPKVSCTSLAKQFLSFAIESSSTVAAYPDNC